MVSLSAGTQQYLKTSESDFLTYLSIYKYG